MQNAVPARGVGRAIWFAALALFLIMGWLLWPGLKAAASLALHDQRYVQIALVPLVCAFLLFWNRNEIFACARPSLWQGVGTLAVAAFLSVWMAIGQGRETPALSIGAVVLALVGGFLLCWGADSFLAALYPIGCMLLMIPLPTRWMDRVVAVLQHGSAGASYALLHVSGIPVLRHGMQFCLPGLTVEVGPECSGIHSSLALLIVALVMGYVYLRSGWNRALLIGLTVPVVICKNALRIAVISAMGAYVNRDFVDGPFHHRYGGILFAGVGVCLFVLVLRGLQKMEGRKAGEGDTRNVRLSRNTPGVPKRVGR